MYSGGTKVLTAHQSLSNYSTLANTIKSLSISGKTITYTKGDDTTGTLTTQDTNTTYSNFVKSGSGAAAGLVPAPSTTAGTTKYLREDGTWQVPPDHTYTVNNATLTIQKNGSNVATFTANASSNVTANITVPTKVSELTNDSGYITGVAWDNVTSKPSFATVATSGSYNDLSNKPTIPTVNNATLTIQKNGTTVNSFTANASSNVTCNITVPTNTNQLTNGNGFITSEIDSQSLGTSGWIRFKNGLQICWELGINRKSLGALYSWNKAFSAVFVAIASDVGPDNGNAVQHLSDTVCIRPYSATQYRLGGYIAAAPDKTDFWIQYIAIGKWK